MFKRLLTIILVVSMMLLVFTGCQENSNENIDENVSENVNESKTFPSKKTVELIAPANPGGGWDATARALQKVITENKLAPNVNVVVTNKPGGSGSVAWDMLIKRKDSHMVALDSSYIYLNELLGVEGAQHYTDLKPICTLTNEWIGFFVKSDSEIKTINDVMDKLKKDPSSIKVAVAPGKGNDDHLSILLTAKTAGVDLTEFDKNIMATTTGELIPGLLGGFYDLIVTGASDGIEFMKSGDVRCIAITADERLDGDFADVPTIKEQGIDVVFPHWRGILGHPDMTDEEVAWWEDLIEKAIATDDWKEVLENNNWEDYYENSEQTMKRWEEEYKIYESLVNEIDLNK